MATQIRDKNGNFVPKTSLNVVRHHTRNRKYLIPVVLAVVAIGVYVVSRSFAATTSYYSVTACAPNYADDCVNGSVQANISLLYSVILGRSAEKDKTGLDYWSKKVLTNGYRYGQVATSFINSSEGKRRYPQADPESYVKQLFKNMYNRQPTAVELAKWSGFIKDKKLTNGQAAAMLAIEGDYHTQQAEATLALMTTTYKIVKPTPPKPQYEVIAKYDLAGKDSKLCKGKVQYDATQQRKVCFISSIESTGGIYEKVVTIPGVTINPGDYQVATDEKYSAASGYMHSGILVSKQDGFTSVKTSPYNSGFPSGFDNAYNYFGYTTKENPMNAGLTTGYNYTYDLPASESNGALTIYGTNFDSVALTTVEIRKSIQETQSILLNTGAVLTGWKKSNYARTQTYNNPPYQEVYNSADYNRACVPAQEEKQCTVTFKRTLSAGQFTLRNHLSAYVSKYDDLSGQMKLSLVVKRSDTGEVVSERDVLADDPIISGVTRKQSLPLAIPRLGGTIALSFTLDTPGEVTVEATYMMPKNNKTGTASTEVRLDSFNIDAQADEAK